MENEDLEAYFDSLSDNDDLIIIDEKTACSLENPESCESCQ